MTIPMSTVLSKSRMTVSCVEVIIDPGDHRPVLKNVRAMTVKFR